VNTSDESYLASTRQVRSLEAPPTVTIYVEVSGPAGAPGAPAPIDPDACLSTSTQGTALGFEKYRSTIRPTAQNVIATFTQTLPKGSCVNVYGFAGFNAKNGANSISNDRARITAALLNERGLPTRTILGLSRTNAATILGQPLDHNRMVVLTTSNGVR
jgi:outer membrane protein OmpA-like peptidoglycan-associated protein